MSNASTATIEPADNHNEELALMPSNNTAKLAYSVPEVAKMLSISRASAYAYVRTGEIRSVTIGGRIIVPRKVLDELLDLEAN